PRLVLRVRGPRRDEADDRALVLRHEDVELLALDEPPREAFAARRIDAGEALRAEDVLVRRLPGAHMHLRDRGCVLEARPPDEHQWSCGCRRPISGERKASDARTQGTPIAVAIGVTEDA